MKKITYMKQTSILFLWVLAVVLLFKFIEIKKTAAIIAGLGFVILPIGIIYVEKQRAKLKSWLVVAGCLQFLLFFAIPIFLLRVIYWESAFDQIYFFGLPASALHRYSNASYLILVGILSFKSFQEWENKKRQL